MTLIHGTSEVIHILDSYDFACGVLYMLLHDPRIHTKVNLHAYGELMKMTGTGIISIASL